MNPSRAFVSLASIFFVFFRIGLLSFGGGISGWIYREVVIQRGWIDGHEFTSGFALAQVLPGANVTNLSVYIGQRLRGLVGAITALLGLLTGPFFAVIGLVTLYEQIAGRGWVQNIMDGAAAAAIGLLIVIALNGGRRASRSFVQLLILAATFIGVAILEWPLVLVVLCLAPVSVFAAWPREKSGA